MNISFSLDLEKILNHLVKNEDCMAQLGNITIKYIGKLEDTGNGKREVFEIEMWCK